MGYTFLCVKHPNLVMKEKTPVTGSAAKLQKERTEGYRKELLEEASKYGIPKPNVEIRSNIEPILKEPRYANMPIGKFVKEMETYGSEKMKKGAEILSKKGVEIGKLKGVTVEVGGDNKIIVSGKYGSLEGEYEKGGEYERGKNKIKIFFYKKKGYNKFTSAHELVHKILDNSAFGEYERTSHKRLETARAAVIALRKKQRKAHEELRRSYEPPYTKYQSEARKKYYQLSKEKLDAYYNFQDRKKEFGIPNAINEAMAHAAVTALGDEKLNKWNLKLRDAAYEAPMSHLYGRALKLIDKVGLKQALEAVLKINPEKAEKSKKFFKGFDDMYKTTMKKLS
jgi:hypothetical protein